MKAARAGHLSTVQFLITNGAVVNRATANNDHTPLSLACAGGHEELVNLLLERGADIGEFYPNCLWICISLALEKERVTVPMDVNCEVMFYGWSDMFVPSVYGLYDIFWAMPILYKLVNTKKI